MTDRPPDDLTALKRALQTAQRPSVSGKTDKQQVETFWPEILQKRTQGWTYVEIHAELKHLGVFQGTWRTLYKYIQARLAQENAACREAVTAEKTAAPRAEPVAATLTSLSPPVTPSPDFRDYLRRAREEQKNRRQAPPQPLSLIEALNRRP
ncbi:MAG: hypothetical protein WAU60_08240 [Candidatus Competibacter denitrificans]|jgi:hypothetical protein